MARLPGLAIDLLTMITTQIASDPHHPDLRESGIGGRIADHRALAAWRDHDWLARPQPTEPGPPVGWVLGCETMSQEPGEAPAATVELDERLLDAKLSVPPPRSGAVSRAALIEAARASECRVVGISAPAGYGKSTLLSEWALAEDRRVAWVSLDRFDDDPAALLTVLASAYARVTPGHADLVADVSGLGVLTPRTRRAPPGFGVPSEPSSVRADAGRPPRSAVTCLSRRAGRRDLGDPSWFPAGRRQSFRAASPATPAGFG